MRIKTIFIVFGRKTISSTIGHGRKYQDSRQNCNGLQFKIRLEKQEQFKTMNNTNFNKVLLSLCSKPKKTIPV